MSDADPPTQPKLTPLAKELHKELETIRRKGWHQFDVSDCRLLAKCFPPSGREAPEAPIRRHLLDLIDPPPVDDRGRPQERVSLEKRKPQDRGLLGRIMFGEPGHLKFLRDGRPDLIIKSRELLVTARYKALAELRNQGNTINASPSLGRPRGGAGTALLLDLRDALLPVVTATVAAGSEPDAATDTSSDKTLANDPPPRLGSAVRESRSRPTLNRLFRFLLGAAVLLAAIGVVRLLIHAIGDSQRPSSSASAQPLGAARSEPKAMAVSAAYNLAAGLRAVNHSYGRRWGTSIRADPTDRMTFALTLRNDAPVTSYPMAAWTQHEDSTHSPYGQRVRLVIATQGGQTLMTTPWVLVAAWTNQVGAFHVNATDGNVIARVTSPGGATLRTVRRQNGPQPNAIPSDLNQQLASGLDNFSIGSLKSGQEVVVTFNASWQPNKAPRLGTYPALFARDGRPSSDAIQVGSARGGDRLRFYVFLDNQGSFPAQAGVRVSFRRKMHRRVVQMTAFGRLNGESTEIGTATINSSDGKPIRIQPVPGSTVVEDRQIGSWVTAPKCRFNEKSAKERHLPDGIALSGVDVGTFGGFTPHSTCAGTEFNKWVQFIATVTRK